MTTVAISDPTREKLGFLNNGNEKFGETIERLVDEEIDRKKIVLPAHLKVLGKLRTFEADEKAYKEFKANCGREGIHVGEKINDFIRDYNKKHGDGNPAYTLEPWQKENSMLAIPALMRNSEEIGAYLNNAPEKIIEEIENQINNVWIIKLNKLFQYGDANRLVV